jgi:serine protease Do
MRFFGIFIVLLLLVTPLDPVDAEQPPLRAESGALIVKVLPGSKAQQAGLQEKDVIIGYDGMRIRRVLDLVSAVDNTHKEKVDLILYRGKQRMKKRISGGKLGVLVDTGVVFCPRDGCSPD